MAVVLRLDRISHSHPDFPPCPLRVSGEVRTGEWLCLAGANGAGKSTLLRLMAGLLRPSHGSVQLEVDGRIHPLPSAAARPQLGYLPPWAHRFVLGSTVGDELACGLEWRGANPDRISAEVARGLAWLGGEFEAGRSTREISAGQRRRLAVAASALSGARVLLMDEPLCDLDPDARAACLGFFRDWVQAGNALVTTSVSAAEAFHADRVWGMRTGVEGVLELSPARVAGQQAADLGLRHARSWDAPWTPGLRPPGTPRASLRGEDVRRDGRPLWSHLSWDHFESGLRAVWGPNGVGKTSLGMWMAGLLELEGLHTDLPRGWRGPTGQRRAQSSLLFQLPEEQMGEESLGREILGEHWDPADPTLERLLARVGLPAHLGSRRPRELSSGERRRAALLGVLNTDPKLWILDEPLGGLDAPAARAVATLLLEESERREVVMMSSDLDLPEVPPGHWWELGGGGLEGGWIPTCGPPETDYLPWPYGTLAGACAARNSGRP